MSTSTSFPIPLPLQLTAAPELKPPWRQLALLARGFDAPKPLFSARVCDSLWSRQGWVRRAFQLILADSPPWQTKTVIANPQF